VNGNTRPSSFVASSGLLLLRFVICERRSPFLNDVSVRTDRCGPPPGSRALNRRNPIPPGRSSVWLTFGLADAEKPAEHFLARLGARENERDGAMAEARAVSSWA
jgi:hypothetical protein